MYMTRYAPASSRMRIFAYAPANRRHRLPISGIKPRLDAIELKSRFLSRSFRKRAQFVQGVTQNAMSFSLGRIYIDIDITELRGVRKWYSESTHADPL